MRVVRHAEPKSFLERAEPAFAQSEAYHNLPLSIARTCVEDPTRYAGPNTFVTVEDEGRVVGVATRTPPHRILVYVPPGRAVASLVDALDPADAIPGVHGPAASADAFAALWSARRGVTSRPAQSMRAFELRRVDPAPPTTGSMRAANAADLALVTTWYAAFERETHAILGAPAAESARRAILDGRLFLWDDGGPLAQAAISGRTPNGARIGGVYTPAASRRRGYATALVADLSRRILAEGRRFAFLFTDLANPVSNSIYPKVGYRPIGDFRDIDFVSA